MITIINIFIAILMLTCAAAATIIIWEKAKENRDESSFNKGYMKAKQDILKLVQESKDRSEYCKDVSEKNEEESIYLYWDGCIDIAEVIIDEINDL